MNKKFYKILRCLMVLTSGCSIYMLYNRKDIGLQFIPSDGHSVLKRLTSEKNIGPGIFSKAVLHFDNRTITQSYFVSSRNKVATEVDRRHGLYSKNVVHFDYGNFNITQPYFASNRSRVLFFKDKSNVNFIGKRDPRTLKGSIYLIENGTYREPHDCGYRGNVKDLLTQRNVPTTRWFYKAAPLFVPDSWSFQHFMDGVLPKLVQGNTILRDPEIKLLFKGAPRDKIINEFFDKLNISRERVIYVRQGDHFGANYLFYLCITPPLHPVLWQESRKLLGAPEVLTVPEEQAYVVFVTREACSNCGRKVNNQKELISLLISKYGKSVVRVFKGYTSLSETVDLFGKSKIVIGSHGGGMYNINFAPRNTVVVEIMPTRADGSSAAASNKIIWAQAVLLGQTYLRMCAEPINSRNDMLVDLREVEALLSSVDKMDQS